MAWFVLIFGINNTSDISKFLDLISRAIRRVKFETILKYHEWYLCQISIQIMLLFVYTTTRKRFVIFTCRYFKLSWNTTALSQLNCRNFSCSGIASVWHMNYNMDLISIYDCREIFFAWKVQEQICLKKSLRKYSNEHTFDQAIFRMRRV